MTWIEIVCVVVSVLFSLATFVVEFLKFFYFGGKLRFLCKKCGALNEVARSDILTDEQLHKLTDFVESVREVRKE